MIKLFDGFFTSTSVAVIYIVLINMTTISAIRAESIFCANINSITRFLISIIFSIIANNSVSHHRNAVSSGYLSLIKQSCI